MNNKKNIFWKTQPIIKTSTEAIGLIHKDVEINTKQTKLPNGFTWRNVDDPIILTKFLNNHYYLNKERFIFNYHIEIIHKLFSSPWHKKEYSIGLFFNDEFSGYIFGKEHKVMIYEKEEYILSVNFLCLKTELRAQNLAPLLITELKRVAWNNGIYAAVFSNDINRGFCFTEFTYYHMLLDIKKLEKLFPIPIGFQSGINNDDYMRKNTKLATKDDFEVILALYFKSCEKFDFYELFSINSLQYELEPCENCNYTLYNSETKEFISFYLISIFDTQLNIKIKKAYLQYWYGTSAIIKDGFIYCKNILNVDMFDVLNMGRNETMIINHFPFLEGTGHLFYHFFNYTNPLTSRSKVNFIFY